MLWMQKVINEVDGREFDLVGYTAQTLMLISQCWILCLITFTNGVEDLLG
jgi:hypothetical protein